MVKPIYIFAINGDSKAKDVTITILQHEKWNKGFQPIAIFENQENIQRKVLARLTDVIGKQFSTLSGNEPKIEKYLTEIIDEAEKQG